MDVSFAERHIQNPVLAILSAPVVADCLSQRLRGVKTVGDIVL